MTLDIPYEILASISKLLCLIPILVSEDVEGSSVATVCPPWKRHCFKDGSYDRYQSSTIVAPWPTTIASKFKSLGKGRELPPGKPKVLPPALVKSVQSALSDLLTTSVTYGTFSRPSAKRGLILIGLELDTNARVSFEHC